MSITVNHNKLAVAFFFIFCVLLFVTSIVSSYDSYDTIGYVGAAKTFETNDKQELHDFIFKNLQNNVAKEDYSLFFRTPYRKAVSESPELFWQQMPFYQVRLVYTSLIYTAHKLGLDYFTASHVIAALAVLLGFIFFYSAFKDNIDPRLWYTLPFFILFMGFVKFSRLINTDTIAFMGIAITCYFIFKEQRRVFIYLPFLTLMRTDMILFNILLTCYFIYYYKEWHIHALASLIVAFIFYFWVNTYYDNYGWATVFYFAFIDRVPNPAEINPTITLSMYFDVIIRALKTQLTGERLMVSSVLVLMVWIVSAQKNLKEYLTNTYHNRLVALSLVCVLYVAAHFFVFPATWYRFFFGQYMLIYFILLIFLTQKIPNLKSKIDWQ